MTSAPPAPTSSAAAPPPRVNRSRRGDTSVSVPPLTAGASAPPKAAPAKAARPTRQAARARLAALGTKLREAVSVLSTLCLLVGFALAAREAHRWLLSTARFHARDIAVEGLGRTTRDEVLAAAGLATPRNVLSLDCESVARAVEGLPWVSRARVTRRLPGTVRVVVEERAPVALVSAGGLYLVAGDGTLFKRAAPGDPADLPVITGVSREDFEQDGAAAREGVRDALALLADVEAAAVGAPMRVDEVHRDATGDLSVVVDGAHVWLGRGPYRAKLTRLRVVLRELARRGLRAGEVHLETDRHPERVTVRLAAR